MVVRARVGLCQALLEVLRREHHGLQWPSENASCLGQCLCLQAFTHPYLGRQTQVAHSDDTLTLSDMVGQ